MSGCGREKSSGADAGLAPHNRYNRGRGRGEGAGTTTQTIRSVAFDGGGRVRVTNSHGLSGGRAFGLVEGDLVQRCSGPVRDEPSGWDQTPQG